MHSKPEHPSKEQPGAKNNHRKKDKIPQANTKPRVRWVKHWALWLVLSAFLVQYIESFDHRLLYLSLLGVLACFIIAAFVQRQDAINYGAQRKFADKQAIRIFVFGLLVCGGLFVWKFISRTHELETDAMGNPAGVLVPANDPTPPIEAAPPIRTNAMFLWLGPTVTCAVEFPHSVIRFKEKGMLVLSTNRDGVTVSAEFFGSDGKIVAAIAENRFTLNRLNAFAIARPDKSTLVVRDQENIELLNIRFMNPRCMKILGHFRFPDHPDIVITTNFLSYEGLKFTRGGFGPQARGGADIGIQ